MYIYTFIIVYDFNKRESKRICIALTSFSNYINRIIAFLDHFCFHYLVAKIFQAVSGTERSYPERTAFLCGMHRLNAKISRPMLRPQQSRLEETRQDLPSFKERRVP